MKVIMPWKGRLAATFVCGVLRVLAFIGVGVLSALVVLALKNGQPYETWLWALAVVAPLSGVLHWLESWIAHDMAFRLLAEMRIDAFRKLDALAPAYLVRRRTGDLMILATPHIDRKSVGEGKSGSVRVDLVGRRTIKKKKERNTA